jgi:hypothetical protein
MSNTPQEYAFKKSIFPLYWRDHKLCLSENTAYKTNDERLRIHLSIYCPYCNEDYVIRGRLEYGFDRFEYRAALAKIAVLGYFNRSCPQRKTKYRNI